MSNTGMKKLHHPPDRTDQCASPSGAPQARRAAFSENYVEYCTYNNCGLRLPTNVAFMYHLWAHVVHFKPHYEADDFAHLPRALNRTPPQTKNCDQTKDDLYRLCICPECLLVAKNPWRMQTHYHLAHKRDKVINARGMTVCNVCELTVRKEDFDAHVRQKHEDSNAPFSCKRCRYRTSTRCALLKHFADEHCGSSMLLCPFCTLAFDISEDQRDRPVATMTSYVVHMLQHDLQRNLQCYSTEDHFGCSAKFSEHTTDNQVKWHVKEHKESVPRSWDQQTQSYASVLEKKESEVRESGGQVCAECSGVFLNWDDHFQEEPTVCDANDCHYTTTCKRSYALHKGLCTHRPENLKRLGRANLTTERQSKLVLFKCLKDGFKTTSSSEILQHTLRCSAEFSVSSLLSRDFKGGMESTRVVMDNDEFSLFAPRESKPPEMSDKPPPRAEVVMRRKVHDLFPPHMVSVAVGNPKMMKAIFDELDTCRSNELHMRLMALTRVNAIQRDSSAVRQSREGLKPSRSVGHRAKPC